MKNKKLIIEGKFQFIALSSDKNAKRRNAKRKTEVSPTAIISIICEANTFVLHFALCILHFVRQ